MPQKPSLVLVDDLIYMVNDGGMASCVEANTGKVVWHSGWAAQYSASPIAAEGRIYFFSQDGPATVIAAGRQFKQLAINRLDEGFMASPAVAGKAIFLRTRRRTCIAWRSDRRTDVDIPVPTIWAMAVLAIVPVIGPNAGTDARRCWVKLAHFLL